MSRWDQYDRGPKVTLPADYLVEWYVENDLGRYKRLSLVGAPVEVRQTWSSTEGGYKKQSHPTHAIICCVMEVPLPRLEHVTQQLRQSTKLRPQAPYLVKAAEAASDAASLHEHNEQLERENRALRKLIIGQAKTGSEYEAVKRKLSEIRSTACEEVERVRRALDEKAADVAAKLLAKMPDDDQ